MLKIWVYRLPSFLLLSQLSCQGRHTPVQTLAGSFLVISVLYVVYNRILEGLKCRVAAFPP